MPRIKVVVLFTCYLPDCLRQVSSALFSAATPPRIAALTSSSDYALNGDNMNKRISVSPNIHFGKPCVRGTRITVQNILELISEGISFDKIIRDYYPELGITDIQACVQYAIDIIISEDIHITAEAA